MVISGIGSGSGLGHSLFQAMTRAGVGTPAASQTDFASLNVGNDPLQPHFGASLSTGASGFQDRIVTTTVDDIALKVDVSRVVKGVPGGASASGDSTTETFRIRVETTVDPLTGQQTQKVVNPEPGSSSPLDPQELNQIADQLARGKGSLQGVVSIDDQRTVTNTYYRTLLARDAQGHLVQTHQISSDSDTFSFTDTAKSTVAFDAANPNVETSAQIAQRLLGEYSSEVSLSAYIPGLNIAMA